VNPLIIDTNERGSLPEAIERRCEGSRPTIPVARQRLIVGDYICGEICVEAKTIGDFIESMRNGHLWRQLDNMDANYQQFALVVWGDIGAHLRQVKARGGKATYGRILKELNGGLARVVADFGCIVCRAASLSEAAYFLSALHQKVNKPASRHGAKAVRRVSTNDVRLDAILTIPGIGQDMAEAILASCGSIEEAACGECLRNVPRMGKVLRNRVIDVLTNENPVTVQSNSSLKGGNKGEMTNE